MTINPAPRLAAFAALVLFLTLAAGCDSGPRHVAVSGTASFDGEAIPEGDITFVPDNKAYGPTQGKIKNGQFEAKATEGDNKVQITASKIRPGGPKGAGGEPVPDDYVPEKYNTKTTLTAKVERSGENKFEFKLTK